MTTIGALHLADLKDQAAMIAVKAPLRWKKSRPTSIKQLKTKGLSLRLTLTIKGTIKTFHRMISQSLTSIRISEMQTTIITSLLTMKTKLRTSIRPILVAAISRFAINRLAKVSTAVNLIPGTINSCQPAGLRGLDPQENRPSSRRNSMMSSSRLNDCYYIYIEANSL